MNTLVFLSLFAGRSHFGSSLIKIWIDRTSLCKRRASSLRVCAMNTLVFLSLFATSASASRLRTGTAKSNVTKVSAEVLELQHSFNSVYVSLKAECKAPGVSDAFNALKNLKGSNLNVASTNGAQCPSLCKGDEHCISICSDVRNMICDASFAPGVVAVASGDSSSVAAAAATAATNAVREAIKDAVGEAAKLSAKSAAEAAAKAASAEASIGAHAVASTAAAAAMAATIGSAKGGGGAPAPAAGAPAPGPAPAGL